MNSQLSKFVYIPINSSITDGSVVKKTMAYFSSVFVAINGYETTIEQIDGDTPLIFLVVSGGTEAMIFDLVSKRNAEFNNEPVILISYPGNNSLAASLEALALIQQSNIKGEIIFLKSGSDEAGLKRIEEWVEGIRVSRKLKTGRVGMVGKPSEWLVASIFDNSEFKSKWGINIINYALEDVFKYLSDRQSHDDDKTTLSEKIKGFDTSKDQFNQAYRVFETLDVLAKIENLDAVSMECFKLFQGYNTHGCFALSRLNDQGIIAGCEGDLPSTLAMLWVKIMFEQVCWMANPVEIDLDNRTLWLAHCTVPLSLVTDFYEDTHFETACGVAVSGNFANGPVTLVRIGGANLEKIWIADADIIDTGNSPHRCRTQALIQFRDDKVLDDLIKKPLGNHIVLTKGHYAQKLLQWWKMFIAP